MDKEGLENLLERTRQERDAALCRCIICTDRTFHMSSCALHNGPAYPPGPCDCGASTVKAELLRCLEELYSQVLGECPSLLEEDSGGDSRLDMEIVAAIVKAKSGERTTA